MFCEGEVFEGMHGYWERLLVYWKKEMSKDCLVSDLLNQCSLGCSHRPVHGRLSRMPLSGGSPST